MRDARMAELAFLSKLNAAGQMDVELHDGQPSENYYGLTQEAFQQMLMYLVLKNLINGDANFVRYQLRGPTANNRELQLQQDINAIYSRSRMTALMNHRGRLRLHELRDELRSSRTKEPFGILYSEEYRERDLEIAFAFLPARQPLSVLFLDLDNFKTVNDVKQHDVGNAVMKRYLQIVHDLTERFGEAYRGRGDEVTVILPQVDAAKAQDIAEAIRAKIESDLKDMREISDLPTKPTASIGGATCSLPVRPVEVFAFADKLMYEAKKSGKNKAVCRRFGEVPLVSR